jgi:hypothetical protein
MYLFRKQHCRVYRHAALLREMLRSFIRIGLLFSVYPFLWLLIVAAVRGFCFLLYAPYGVKFALYGAFVFGV